VWRIITKRYLGNLKEEEPKCALRGTLVRDI